MNFIKIFVLLTFGILWRPGISAPPENIDVLDHASVVCDLSAENPHGFLIYNSFHIGKITVPLFVVCYNSSTDSISLYSRDLGVHPEKEFDYGLESTFTQSELSEGPRTIFSNSYVDIFARKKESGELIISGKLLFKEADIISIKIAEEGFYGTPLRGEAKGQGPMLFNYIELKSRKVEKIEYFERD